MPTQERLEGITDRGLFEALATAVLREAEPDYRGIIHTGLNASLETITAPIDGFVRVPGREPPQYVFFAHSTTDRSALRRKWLAGEGSAQRTAAGEGDLIKAGRLAAEMRAAQSRARFRVVLTTNQHVDLGLARDVDTAAESLGVEAEIWDQHRLAHILDHHPVGQWVRRHYLGVAAEQVSLPLLGELSRQSLALYGEQFLGLRPERLVTRRLVEFRDSGALRDAVSIRLLVGESGCGKSTASYSMLNEAVAAGHLGFWIAAEDAAASITLAEALGRTLRRLSPALTEGVGQTTLDAIPWGERLVVVVDDISRNPSAEALLRKVIGWIRPAGSDRPNTLSGVLLIAPVWTTVWSGVRHGLEKQSWLAVLPLGLLDDDEAQAATTHACLASGLTLPEPDAAALARVLGNDPLAIGLFGELLEKERPERLSSLANETLERFVNIHVHASAANCEFLPPELDAALLRLADAMLRERRLYPSWLEVQSWFEEPDVTRALRCIVREAALVRVEEPAREGRLVFRHDRLRDLLLERILENALEEGGMQEVLEDPYYAELIAAAFDRSPNLGRFANLERHAPFAIIALLRHMPAMENEDRIWLRGEVQKWAERRFVTSAQIPEAERAIMTELLLEANDPVGWIIAEHLGKGHALDLVRFRGGDVEAGIRSCMATGLTGFAPAQEFPVRDQAIRMAWSNYRDAISTELSRVLTDPDATIEYQEGALALAGLIPVPGLQREIACCWAQSSNQSRIIADVIWAAARCSTNDVPAVLSSVFDAWEMLSDKPEQKAGSAPRNRIADTLRFAFRHAISETVLAYFVEESTRRPALRWPLLLALSHVDHPLGVACVVRAGAELRRKAAAVGGFSPWASSMGHAWDESAHGRRMSESSIATLKALWTRKTEEQWVREQAFRIWATATGGQALAELRQVQPGDPQYDDALWHRMRAGDHEALDAVLPRLCTKSYWLTSAGSLWGPEVRAVVEQHLVEVGDALPRDFSGGREDLPHSLAELLRDIPPADAEHLLEQHWTELQFGALFVQAALYVGTDACRRLAAEAIAKAGADAHLLQYVNHYFGIKESRRESRLTNRHLESLAPYIAQMDAYCRGDVAYLCRRLGRQEWGVEHLRPYLNEAERREQPLTQEDLVTQLHHRLTLAPGSRAFDLEVWTQWTAEGPDGTRRTIEAAAAYFAQDRNAERYEVLCYVVGELGSRQDLLLLADAVREEGRGVALADAARLRVRRRTLE